MNGQMHDQSQSTPGLCTHGWANSKVRAAATSKATRLYHYVFSQEVSVVTSKVDTHLALHRLGSTWTIQGAYRNHSQLINKTDFVTPASRTVA